MVQKKLAKDVKCTMDELERLSKDRDWQVRINVARNLKTSAETLAKLSEDTGWKIRCNIAENPNAPSFVLEKLSGDKIAIIRGKAVQNINNFRIREMMKVGMNASLSVKNNKLSKLDMIFF